jgi:hypothetical protein
MRMRHGRMALGLAATMCALGVGAASASASEFESTGGITKGLSVSKNEEFKVWPMTVACQKALTKGSVGAGKFAAFSDEVKYTFCTTFAGGLKVAVSPGHFEYNADGVVTILSPITITPGVLKCHYEIPAQAGFAKESVLFSDVLSFSSPKGFPEGKQKLQIESILQGMHYTAVGWPCIGPKSSPEKVVAKEESEEGEEGKFAGKVEEEIVSGNLTWIK